MPQRTLDWKPTFDDRSRNYAVRTLLRAAEEPKPRRDKLWTPSPIMDQGVEGACVGYAWAGEALASPIRVDLARLKQHVPQTPQNFARFLYGMARYLDPWTGEDYDGTSVLAGAKAAQNVGVLREYRWAFGIDDVIDSVINIGPVVIGINWYSGMYEAPNGVLTRSGNLVGGHALYVHGYREASHLIPGAPPALVIRNSWGAKWGIKGMAHISVPQLAGLLAENGEACVPVSRSYGRS